MIIRPFIVINKLFESPAIFMSRTHDSVHFSALSHNFIHHSGIIIIIIIVIFKCYFSREHITLSYKNDVNIELGKSNRLKALCMMQNNT